MEARHIQLHLRRCGVVVHHAAAMPASANGPRAVVVYLEAGLQQYELARRCALRLPEVTRVSFSGHTPTIMFVDTADPGGRADRTAGGPTSERPGDPVKDRRGPGPVPSPGAARRPTTARPRN